MNALFHLLINFLFSIPISSADNFSIKIILLISFAGIIIDIDHLFFYFVKGFKTFRQDFKNSKPHFYIFHTIEFLILSLLLSLIFKPLIWVFLGFLIHLATDALAYVYKYKTNFFWLRFWSAIYYWS